MAKRIPTTPRTRLPGEPPPKKPPVMLPAKLPPATPITEAMRRRIANNIDLLIQILDAHDAPIWTWNRKRIAARPATTPW